MKPLKKKHVDKKLGEYQWHYKVYTIFLHIIFHLLPKRKMCRRWGFILRAGPQNKQHNWSLTSKLHGPLKPGKKLDEKFTLGKISR